MFKLAVIGVDPGKMTGIFAWHYFERAPGFPKPDPKPVFGFDARHVPAEDVPKVMRHMLHAEYVDMPVSVAVEKFIINARTAKLSQQSEALEVTGMIKAIAALDDVDVRQYLKANLRFASDAALSAAGWHAKGMRHANDAARQAYALLKDVDYPTWLNVSNGAMMEIDDTKKG